MLVQQGQMQIARAIVASVQGWFTRLTEWHSAMPSSLPPTEFRPR